MNFTMTAENKRFAERVFSSFILLLLYAYILYECIWRIDYPVNMLGVFLSAISLVCLVWVSVSLLLEKKGIIAVSDVGKRHPELNNRHMITMVATVIYALLLLIVGMYAATAMFVLFVPYLLKYRSYRDIAITLLGTLAFLYVINVHLRVILP